MTKAYVVAKLAVPASQALAADAEGTWLATLYDDCPEEFIEKALVKLFTESQGIDDPSQFEIRVVDEDGLPFDDQSDEELTAAPAERCNWADLVANVGPVNMLDGKRPTLGA